jgi:uncharacterized protein YjbI with pentapeptide repeats
MWQQIKQRRVAVAVTTAIIVIAIVLIIVGYWFDVPGFNGYTQVSIIRTLSGPTSGTVTRTEVFQPGKTVWDWLQLLIIPAVLALGGYLFTFTISRNERKAADRHNQTEREIAQDNQREAALKEYFEKISELILHENLRHSDPDAEVQKIARVWTLTALRQLDAHRKRSLLQFLYESDLLEKDEYIVDLDGADLSGADLSRVNLHEANLHFANLSRADLQFTKLHEANLSGADLSEAILIGADLNGADLSGADLSGAILIQTDLSGANLHGTKLNGANLIGASLIGTSLIGTSLINADLTGANLKGAFGVTVEELEKLANSLPGTIMPDGSKHP